MTAGIWPAEILGPLLSKGPLEGEVQMAAKRVAAKKVTAKKPATRATSAQAAGNASRLIDSRIKDLGDWRGEMRTPVWSHDGIICTGETYESIVKLTFAKGASLADPAHLFNSSLEGNVRRAIDIHEGEKVR
jgi:hypothetical protein